MGNYTGLKGKASAVAINNNRSTAAALRAASREGGTATFQLELNGKTSKDLTTKVENNRVYYNNTSRYDDLKNNSVVSTLRAHIQPGTIIRVKLPNGTYRGLPGTGNF
jgi:hypothetical protein